jgi:hypothetical protein
MRFLLKISFPVEAATTWAKQDGFKAIQQSKSPKRPTSSLTAESGPDSRS